MSEFNVYLLRHGELMQAGILCGRTDIALSEKGKQQLIDATKILPNISQCYSSPLIRCRAFAQEYCQQTNLSLKVSTQLQEMDFGDWDGMSYQALWQTKSSLNDTEPTLGKFWQNPWQCQPPNGEAIDDFIQRVDDFWQSLLAQYKQQKAEESSSENTLVISHGGVIRYILAKVLALPIPGTIHMTNIDVPYGALIHTQIVIDDEGNAWPKLKL